jgi:hypothetical protein
MNRCRLTAAASAAYRRHAERRKRGDHARFVGAGSRDAVHRQHAGQIAAERAHHRRRRRHRREQLQNPGEHRQFHQPVELRPEPRPPKRGGVCGNPPALAPSRSRQRGGSRSPNRPSAKVADCRRNEPPRQAQPKRRASRLATRSQPAVPSDGDQRHRRQGVQVHQPEPQQRRQRTRQRHVAK